MEKWTALVTNPAAGDGSADDDAARVVAAWSRSFVDVRMVRPAEGEGLRELAARVVRDGAGVVVAFGGDGSLHEVVNGVASVPGALERVLVGIVPAGTGNDFARSLGLPLDIDAASAALSPHRFRGIDLGLANGEYFVNASAGGFFGEVSEATTSALKRRLGAFAYLLGGGKAFFEHEPFAVELRAQSAFGPLAWAGRMSMFAVCNGSTTGGGAPLAPNAAVDDGWLDAFFVEAGDKLDLAQVLLHVSNGEHGDDERVIAVRVSRLELRADRAIQVNLDGEVRSETHLDYACLHRALRVLAPADVDIDRKRPHVRSH